MERGATIPADAGAMRIPAVNTRLLPIAAWPYLLSAMLMLVVFLADLVMPRGAAPAIGYCAVIVLAAGSRRIHYLIAIASISTILSWFAYWLEPVSSPEWMSVFDRAIVNAVLWLTVFLSIRRERALREITFQSRQLQQVARNLARSNAELDRFASIISHDLRSPVASVSLSLELLNTTAAQSLAPEDAQLLHEIGRGVRGIGDMIQSLRSLTRVDSISLTLTSCNCEHIVEFVLTNLKADMLRSGATVHRRPLPKIRADRNQLIELFQNLLENSLKYHGAEPPHIVITAQADLNFWTFRIFDNGIGVPPEDRERIFEIFHRAHGSAQNRPGSGMGLAICKTIVQRHGGRIWVEPAPDHGSVFAFTMPRELAPDTP